MCQYTIFCIVQKQLIQEAQVLQEIFEGICSGSLGEYSYTLLKHFDLSWRKSSKHLYYLFKKPKGTSYMCMLKKTNF